jgi:hypothetical protein
MNPTLALACYHCCSIDPHAAIFNDELGSDVGTSALWDRISNLIGDPIWQEETVLCQQTFKDLGDHTPKMLLVHIKFGWPRRTP